MEISSLDNTNNLLSVLQNVDPVGKRVLVAVDVSASLSSVVPGTAVSTAVAAAAITMVRWCQSQTS